MSKIFVEKHTLVDYTHIDKEYMIVEQSDITPILGSNSSNRYFTFVDHAEERKDQTGYFLTVLDKSECKIELAKSKEEQLKLNKKIEILSMFLEEMDKLNKDNQNQQQ